MATSHNSLLIDLLNNDTFVGWIRGGEHLSKSEKEEWDEWLQENQDHIKIVQHAKKILEMPFKEVKISCNSTGKLDRLLESLDKEDNQIKK